MLPLPTFLTFYAAVLTIQAPPSWWGWSTVR